MLRKVVLIIAIAAIVFSVSGCKRSSEEGVLGEEEVKSAAEYEAEAEKEIDEENMAEELDRIEQEMEAEAGS